MFKMILYIFYHFVECVTTFLVTMTVKDDGMVLPGSLSDAYSSSDILHSTN